MKFRFYIVSTDDGLIYGTNNSSTADGFVASEEHFVIDADTGEWLSDSEEWLSDSDRIPVKELK